MAARRYQSSQAPVACTQTASATRVMAWAAMDARRSLRVIHSAAIATP